MKVLSASVSMLIAGWLAASTGERPKQESPVDAAQAAVPESYGKGVVGSKHDLAGQGWSNPCNACHIPHIQTVRSTTQPVARMYRIPGQRRVFAPNRFTPGPTSLICLGCHDGTVATSTIGTAHALLEGVREGFHAPEGYAWRDHPIGIPYPNNRRKYRPEALVKAKGNIRLPDGRIECVSCHDPHNTSGQKNMLVMSNRRSALCVTCHIK